MEDIIRKNNMWVDTSFNDDYLQTSEEEGCYPLSSRTRRIRREGSCKSSATDEEMMVISPRRYQQRSNFSPDELSPRNDRFFPPSPAYIRKDSYNSHNSGSPSKEPDSISRKTRKSSGTSSETDSPFSADNNSCSRSKRSATPSNNTPNTPKSRGSNRRSTPRENSRRMKPRQLSKKSSSSKRSETNVIDLPSHDETVYLQTFYKVMNSFNDKQKTSLALDECGKHDEPMYRRIVFQIIHKLNKDPHKCTTKQQDLVMQSLTLICNDTSPATEQALEGAIEDVLTFFLTVFYSMLSTRYTRALSVEEEDNLRSIVELVGVMALKSAYFRKKIAKRQIFRRFIDKITAKSSYITRPNQEEDGGNVLNVIVDIAMKSQLLHILMLDIKAVLTSISESVTEPDVSEYYDTPSISSHLERVEDSNFVLLNCRKAMKSLLDQINLGFEDDVIFNESRMIPRLMKQCNLTDLASCSHLLKVIIMLGQDHLFLDIILKKYSKDIVTLFLATLRCEETALQDGLMKFWLTQRLCRQPQIRNLLFRSEGGIVEIFALMRAVRLDAGKEFELLAPFCDDVYFLDVTLTNAQILQYFGNCFQSGETDLLRKQAANVLKFFTEGLDCPKRSPGYVSISNCVLESGLLFSLLNVISVEECEVEWMEKGTELLCALVNDEVIRHGFVGEPLGVLHCLVTSLDSFQGRTALFASLVAILTVLAPDPEVHPRLFESDVVIALADHIKDTLTTESACAATEVEAIVTTLHVFEVIASTSEKSCQIFKQMELEVFLSLLLQHDDQEVRDMVQRVLVKLGPTQWKQLFRKATQL